LFNKSSIIILLISLLITTALFLNHLIIYEEESTISSPAALGEHYSLISYPHVLPSARNRDIISNGVPFRYRFLFLKMVTLTCFLINTQWDIRIFWLVFLFWSYLIWTLVFHQFIFFLKDLGFANRLIATGVVFFTLCFPVILAYHFPVNTREDPLAYLFVLIGMRFALQSKWTRLCITSLVGVPVRETTLVMLVLSGWKRMFKLVPVGLAIFVLIRIGLGWESYNPLCGLNLNLKNPVYGTYFFYMTFGWLWFVSLGGKVERLRETYPLALVFVILTAFLFSRLEENRISFLLFPWTIPMAMDTLRRLSIVHLIKIAIPSLFATILIFEVGVLDLLHKYYTFNWQWFDRILFYSNASLTVAFCIYVGESFFRKGEIYSKNFSMIRRENLIKVHRIILRFLQTKQKVFWARRFGLQSSTIGRRFSALEYRETSQKISGIRGVRTLERHITSPGRREKSQ
jgi:hypothetical protein